MNRLSVASAAALILSSAALPALASESAPTPSDAAAARQSVMMCANDADTRRAYVRQHGDRPQFVTAEQALNARSTGERWSAPRCMNAREYGRLVQMMGPRARVR